MKKFLTVIKWLIDTFKVALSIVIVVLLLQWFVGCANLESLVHKEESVSRETSLIKIGESKWDTEEKKVKGTASLSITGRVNGLRITMEVVAV